MIADHRDRPSTFNTAVCGEPQELTYRECCNEDGYDTHKFNMTETGFLPFYKSSDDSFKEGYMCAMEFVKMSYCRKCGEKNPLLDVQYESRKSALDKVAFMKSAPARDPTQKPQLNYDGRTGTQIVYPRNDAFKYVKLPWKTSAK